MPRGLGLSILLHIGFILVVGFGLPVLFPQKTEFTPAAISVEIVPIREFTNLKKSKKPITRAKRAKAKNKKAVPKTKQEASKPTPAEEDPIPLPETKKTVETKSETPAPKPKEKKKPEPTAIRSADSKSNKKKKESKQEQEDDEFAALLSKLNQESVSDKDAELAEDSAEENTSRSDNYNPTIPLSMSEKDAIRNQFLKCWRMPAGARNDYDLAVRVRLLVNPDGSVREVGLVPDQVSRYQSDTFFRAAADSALRAVQLCSPLKGLPPDKYDTWRDMELNFDPLEMLY